MYKLILTADERKAIDFVGNRYANGDNLYRVLTRECQTFGDDEWDSDEDIIFLIPEYAAWCILDIEEYERGLWPLFAPELAKKMQAFCDSVV